MMSNQLTVQDLLNIIGQYKEELKNTNEQKIAFKALLERQLQRIEELEKENAELKNNQNKEIK